MNTGSLDRFKLFVFRIAQKITSAIISLHRVWCPQAAREKAEVIFALLLKNKKGSAGGITILLGMLTVIVVMLLLEAGRDYVEMQRKQAALENAVKMAVAASVRDEYRQDHLARINADMAVQIFYDELKRLLELGDSLEYERKGYKYQIIIKKLEVEEEPPQFEVEAAMEVEPVIFKNLINRKLRIPLKAKAKNRRKD